MDPDTAELYRSLQDPNSDESVRRQVYANIKPYVGHEMDMPAPTGAPTGNTMKDLLQGLLGATGAVSPRASYGAHMVPRMYPSPFKPEGAPEGVEYPPNLSLQQALTKSPVKQFGQDQPGNMPYIPKGAIRHADSPIGESSTGWGYEWDRGAGNENPSPYSTDMEKGPPSNPKFPWVGKDLPMDKLPTSGDLNFETMKARLDKMFKGESDIAARAGTKSPTHQSMYDEFKGRYGKDTPFQAANEDPLTAWTRLGEFSPMVKQWFHRELGFGNPQQMLYERALLDQALTPQGKGISLDTVKQLQAKHNMIRMLSRKFPDEFQLPKGYKP